MKQRVPISQIMSTVLIAVPTTKKISEVNQMFTDYNIRHIPVIAGEHLVGIISSKDVLKIGYASADMDQTAQNAIYDSFQLEDVMTQSPVVVSEDTIIKEVAELFAKQRFHSLPVVDRDNKLVGIVTTTDMITYLVAQY